MSTLPHFCQHVCQKIFFAAKSALCTFKPAVSDLLSCTSKFRHTRTPVRAHTAFNLTRPGGIRCQTVSALLLCVKGGSANPSAPNRQKMFGRHEPKPVMPVHKKMTRHFLL